MWMILKKGGKKQTMARMCKKLMKNVDLDEPTWFLDHVCLGRNQRECKQNVITEENTKMFEPQNFFWSTWKITRVDKPHAKKVAWSYDMEGRAQKCIERYCELASKKTEQLCKVSCSCLDDHQFKQEELESGGELSEVCSHIVLKCLYLARIGRPDIPWSVNEPATSVTKWTQACDRLLARLTSYIHHRNDYRQYRHVCNTAQHGRLGLLQDLDFAGDPGIQNQPRGDLMYFGKPNFCQSYICSNQLDVQETDFSFAQFYRIRNHIVGCWTANGWVSCSWFMGCGHRSVTFIEQHQNTNQLRSRKLFSKSQIQTQTKGEPRCWSIVALS